MPKKSMLCALLRLTGITDAHDFAARLRTLATDIEHAVPPGERFDVGKHKLAKGGELCIFVE